MNEAFATRERLTVSVEVPAGTVEVEAAETTESTVLVERVHGELDPSEVDVRLRDESGRQTLVVKVGRRRFRDARYRVVIRTHAGADLRIDTGAADVRADGTFGTAKIHSASGDITVGELRGTGKLRTASGDVSVTNALGEVEIDSASGSVTVGTTHARATLHSVSGDVEVDEALSDLAVKTVSGDLRVGSVSRGEISAHTVSGDVDFGVRAGSTAFIDAHSMSGEMRSDLDVTHSPATPGHPDVELRAKTLSGDVSIRRAATQAA